MMANYSAKNARRLASYFSQTFGNDKILICPLERNGALDFVNYEKIIRESNYPFHRTKGAA